MPKKKVPAGGSVEVVADPILPMLNQDLKSLEEDIVLRQEMAIERKS